MDDCQVSPVTSIHIENATNPKNGAKTNRHPKFLVTLNKLLDKVEKHCPNFTRILAGVGKNLRNFHKVVNFKPNAKFLASMVKMKYTTHTLYRKGHTST